MDLKARIYKKTFLAVYYVITILSVFLFELSVQAYIIMWFELNHDDDRSVKGVWLTHCVTFSFCTYSKVYNLLKKSDNSFNLMESFIEIKIKNKTLNDHLLDLKHLALKISHRFVALLTE